MLPMIYASLASPMSLRDKRSAIAPTSAAANKPSQSTECGAAAVAGGGPGRAGAEAGAAAGDSLAAAANADGTAA